MPRIPFLLTILFVSATAAQAQILEWSTAIGGPGSEAIEGITTDSQGNVYSVGEFEETVDFDAGPGEWLLTAPEGKAHFLMKQSPSGELAWAVAFPKLLSLQDIVVDGAGGIVLAGAFWFTQDFDPGPGTVHRTSAGSGDIFALKLNAAGEFQWVYTVGSSMLDQAHIVELLGDRVIVAGGFQGSMDFDPGPGTAQGTGADAFAVSLSAGGDFEWAALTDGPGLAQTWAMDTDADSVYVSGEFDSPTWFGDVLLEPVNNLPPIDGWDGFMAKIDGNGNFLWAAAIASQEWDRINGIVGDPMGNAVGVGFTHDIVDADPGPGELLLGDGGLTPIVIKLDQAGELVWAGAFDTFGSCRDVVMGRDGGPIVLGNFGTSVDADPGPGVEMLFGEDQDGFVIKLTRKGTFLWAGSVGGASSDFAHEGHVSRHGHLYVGGQFEGDADLDPGPDDEETPAPGFGDDIFLLKIRPFPVPGP